jgi:predicted ATP-grasp superfamily ATP-dependent carboligase
MLIFVYEFTCAAKSGDGLNSLGTEGWAMLSAVVQDLNRIPGVEVLSLLNAELFPTDHGPHFLPIDPAKEETIFRELAGKSDYTLVIAPELDDILAARCDWVEQAGGTLLGSSIAAVRLTADKIALAQHLGRKEIRTPVSRLFNSNERDSLFPAVLKPRFGAGSVETYLIQSPDDWAHRLPRSEIANEPRAMIIQPFVSGQAASVAFLIGPNQTLALPPASQILSNDGRFHYLGGHVPLPHHLTDRAQRLACRAVESVPGLHGYVGIDLVLGSAPDGSEDWVIEINPRLTTSYIGLRALAESNLAQALVDIAVGKEVQSLKWRPGQVQFSCDGKVNFKT